MNTKNKLGLFLAIALLLVGSTAAQEIIKYGDTPSTIQDGGSEEFNIMFDDEAARNDNAWGTGEVEKITLKGNDNSHVIASQDGGISESSTDGSYDIYTYSTGLSNLNLQVGNTYDVKAEVKFVEQGLGSTTTYQTETTPVEIKGETKINSGFSYSPNNPGPGEQITFSDSSNVKNANVNSVDFNIERASTKSTTKGGTIKHTFKSEGSYDVTQTLKTDQGDDTTTKTVDVSATVNPSFTYSPNNPGPGEDITFSDESTVEHTSVESIDWKFGDGRTASGSEVTRSFDDAGSQNVELTVNTNHGSESTSKNVDVSFTLEPDFSYTPSNPNTGDQITFSDKSTVNKATAQSYEWNFGNGETKIGETTTHTFNTKGTHNVELKVNTNHGSNTKSKNIGIGVETYELSLNTKGNGSIIGDSEGQYEPGTEITLEASPKQGNKFSEFTGSQCDSKKCSFTMPESDVSIAAKFDQKVENEESGLENLEPEYKPSEGSLELNDGSKVPKILWRDQSHEDSSLDIVLTGEGEKIKLSCKHDWLGDLGNQTKTLNGETTFSCTMPSIMHNNVENIHFKICNTQNNNCREISKELAFGIDESRDENSLDISAVEHADSTTGDIPVTILTDALKVDKVEFDFGNRKLEKTNLERNYGKVKTKLEEEELSYGLNEFEVTAYSGNSKSEKTVSSQIILLNEVEPSLEFSSLALQRNVLSTKSLKASIKVKNPQKSLYVDNVTVKALVNGSKDQKIYLGELSPDEQKEFEFEVKSPYSEEDRTLKIEHRGRNVGETNFRLTQGLGLQSKTVNHRKKAKDLAEELKQDLKNSENQEKRMEVSSLETELETLESLNISDEKMRSNSKRIHNKLKEIESKIGGEDDEENLLTGKAISTTSQLAGSLEVIHVAILGLLAALAILYQSEEADNIKNEEEIEYSEENLERSTKEDIQNEESNSLPSNEPKEGDELKDEKNSNPVETKENKDEEYSEKNHSKEESSGSEESENSDGDDDEIGEEGLFWGAP